MDAAASFSPKEAPIRRRKRPGKNLIFVPRRAENPLGASSWVSDRQYREEVGEGANPDVM